MRLSLWLLLPLLKSITFPSFVLAKEEGFQPYGRPLLPRDISFDKSSRTALKRLRRHSSMAATTAAAIAERDQVLQELSTAGNDEKVIWTLIGYKGGAMKDQINQDRAFIIDPFQIHPINISNEKKTTITNSQPNGAAPLLLGVFDGHGKLGEVVSEYTVTELPRRLAKELEDIIIKFHETEDLLDQLVSKALIKVFQDIDQSVPTKGQGGCTASVVLRLGSKIYVANAGDSVSFVASYTESTDQVDVLYVTREDKPHLPDEYQRIIGMGGQVSQPDGEGDSSRVLFVDRNTGYMSGLAMSRSIGDWDATGVISDPIVQVLSIPELLAKVANQSLSMTTTSTCVDDLSNATTEDLVQQHERIHLFAVSASDGLMDYFEPNEIARKLADSFYKRSAKIPHPHVAAEDLILKAAEGWHEDMGGQYRDDITIAASRIYSPKNLI